MEKTAKKQDTAPVVTVEIDDASIPSILDTGFVRDYAVTSYLHSHSYYELFAAVEAALYLEGADHVQWTLPAGSICLIPPGFFHRVRAGDKLAIRFQVLPRDCETERDTKSVYDACTAIFSAIHTPLIRTDTDSDSLCRLLLTIRDELSAHRLGGKTYASLLLGTFYIRLIRSLSQDLPRPLPDTPPADTDPPLRQLEIDEYFTAHYAESITAEDMARDLHLSKRQLSRILSAIYNRSFREILINTRLQQALHLLTGTAYSIEEIAAMVGYGSLSGFYAAFQKRFSVTAGEYRRAKRDVSVAANAEEA